MLITPFSCIRIFPCPPQPLEAFLRISITNHATSRNRGCEALVQGILAGLATQPRLNVTEINLHSWDSPFDQWRFGDRLHCIQAYAQRAHSLHPRIFWLNKALYHLAVQAEKALPARFDKKKDLSTASDADLIISTGGDVFSLDYGYFYCNTTYLNLGTPVFMCAHSIGPFTGREEEYFKKSSRNICLMTARESHTYAYLKQLNLSCPVEQTADVAFLLPVMDREDTYRYARKFHNADLRGRKLIGLSVSELITKYYKYGREEGVKQIAQFIDWANDLGYGVVLIPHVSDKPVNVDDAFICQEVLRQVKSPDANVAMNGWFSSIEAKSVIGLCDVLLGARTHATIASLSQGIPTVAIAYSRKAYGIMEDYYGPELAKKLILPADRVYAESLAEAMKAALEAGRQDATAAKMKSLALRNFELLSDVVSAKR